MNGIRKFFALLLVVLFSVPGVLAQDFRSAEELLEEMNAAYSERRRDPEAYQEALTRFSEVLRGRSFLSDEEREMARMGFRQAWTEFFSAEYVATCARHEYRQIQLRNSWGPMDVPDSIKSVLSWRLSLQNEMLRSLGWVQDLRMQLGLDWLDPSGMLRELLGKRCETVRDLLRVYEKSATTSSFWETLKYTFRRSDQNPEDHVEHQLVEFGDGFQERLGDLIKDLPGNFWYEVKGRAQTVYGWMSGDELTYELTRDVYSERSRQWKGFKENPSDAIVNTTDHVLAKALTLNSREIGAITADFEVAVVLERGIRRFAVSSLAKTPVSPSGRRMAAEIAHLNRRVLMDPLSRVFNKGALFLSETQLGELGLKIQNMISKGTRVSALYLDGDFFKAFNDLLSHSAGDDLIRTFAEEARAVAKSIREGDLVFRMGGEEFVVILPETSLDDAVLAAKRLQENIRQSQMRIRLTQQIQEKCVELEGRRGVDVLAHEKLEGAFRGLGHFPESGNVGTVSIGVAEAKPGEAVKSLIDAADEALKLAKDHPGKQGIAMRLTTEGQDSHVLVNGVN